MGLWTHLQFLAISFPFSFNYFPHLFLLSMCSLCKRWKTSVSTKPLSSDIRNIKISFLHLPPDEVLLFVSSKQQMGSYGGLDSWCWLVCLMGAMGWAEIYLF